MKRVLLDLAIIITAIVSWTLLLKKGEQAGASYVAHPSSEATERPAVSPVRPQVIWGRLDNFKESIPIQPMHSWGAEAGNAIRLTVATDSTNQPSARVTLAQPTTSPIVLEVQYTVPEEVVQVILANAAIKNKTDGVTVLMSTVGLAYQQSSFLTLDPVRNAAQRQWMTSYLALPTGTQEIDFSIIGPPPGYNVFMDSCAISLPQLRLSPATGSTPAATPARSAK